MVLHFGGALPAACLGFVCPLLRIARSEDRNLIPFMRAAGEDNESSSSPAGVLPVWKIQETRHRLSKGFRSRLGGLRLEAVGHCRGQIQH